MVHSFAKTGTLNTAVPLATARTPAAWAIIQAKSVNVAAVRVVARGTDGTFPTVGGAVLAPGTGGNPGGSVLLPWMGAPLPYDFTTIGIIITNTGDGVDVIYGS